MTHTGEYKHQPLEGLWPFLLSIGLSLLLALGSVLFQPAHAAENTAKSFWEDRERGWYWYEDPVKELEEKPKDTEKQTPPPPPVETKTDGSTLSKNPKLRSLQVRVREALDAAVAEPTEQNVLVYLKAKQEADQHAAMFTDQFRRVLWKTPELDYTQVHPVNAVGSRIDRKNDKTLREDAARLLAQTDGIFFFFTESCPYCQAQAPILKNMADRFGINVLAISLDGTRLPEFPEAVDDIGWAERFNITTTPTMLMVNPSTGGVEALSYGLATEDDLMNRIYVLSQARLGAF